MKDGSRKIASDLGFNVPKNVNDPWPVDPEPIVRTNGIDAPFPSHCLPPIMRDWSLAATDCLETPSIMAPLTALGILAAATQGQIHVEINPGWSVPSNLYVAPIGLSGERKSPLMRSALAGLNYAQDWLTEQHGLQGPKAEQANIKRRKAKKLSDEAAKDMENAPGLANMAAMINAMMLEAEADDPGPSPRLWSQDTTAEKLEDRLEENRGRFAVLSDEGGTLGTLGRYGTGDANLDVLLQGWDGGSVSADRRSRQVNVKRAYITMVIMLQPFQLGILAHREFAERGLAARFLYGWSPTRIGYRKASGTPIPMAIHEAWRDLTASMAIDCHNDMTPTTLTCSPEAVAHLTEFVESAIDGTEIRMRLGGDLSDNALRAWGSKLPGQVGRIAGLLHVGQEGWRDEEPTISGTAMANACTIGRALIPHASESLHVVAQSEWITLVLRLVAWLADKDWPGTFNLRDWYRAVNVDSDDAKSAANHMVIRGWIRPTVTEPHAGRPSSDYDTHPRIADLAGALKVHAGDESQK